MSKFIMVTDKHGYKKLINSDCISYVYLEGDTYYVQSMFPVSSEYNASYMTPKTIAELDNNEGLNLIAILCKDNYDGQHIITILRDMLNLFRARLH